MLLLRTPSLPTPVSAASVTSRAGWPPPYGGSILADVLVRHLGVGRDPIAEHADAALVGEVNHVDAGLAQPLDPAVEVHRLAHHHGADVELPHQAAAVPARGERGDHDGVAIAALAAGLAEGVGFAVHGRDASLNGGAVAAAEQAAVVVITRSQIVCRLLLGNKN